MNSTEIREKFIAFFKERGHTVVESSSLMPEADPTLLFTNAGMVQFKKVFLGEEKRDYNRAVSCQKCLRAGGKHNDLENVGQTARHQTFFEMLGNFSFGDYFKAEAIEYAWEFLTEVMGLPKDKLYATVFEEDDEAEKLWLEKTDIAPEQIKRLGAEDNFWSMGDVGPCGPCSEILIDQGAELGCGKAECKAGCDCDRYLEIWNLVFMQYDRSKDGNLKPLPKPSIDTGMGLERLAAVIQNKKSNYETDTFAPIIKFTEKLTGQRCGKNPETDLSIRAIADHSRAVAFLITDGVLPSNEGRGYVLRRIIRRAVRHGYFLGLRKPFLYKVADLVTDIMGEVYPEAKNASSLIGKATLGEEERFFETIERGLGLLEEEVKKLKKENKKTLDGETAFKLYDTYGFPLDLTADIIKRENLSVDEDGFNEAMEAQRQMARKSWKGTDETLATDEVLKKLRDKGVTSEFLGYDNKKITDKIITILKDGEEVESAKANDEVSIITSKTPFYAESGGQTGDRGTIKSSNSSIDINDTKKIIAGIISHTGKVKTGTIKVGDKVELEPNKERRIATARNHTATHILHSALRETLGEHVRQAGSLVTEDSLRFDFNHFQGLTSTEIRTIEEKANKAILENINVVTQSLPYKEALKKGALAFFGEKYGETVRMVQVGGVSTELCGGTHVSATGEIGLIKIKSEGSVASGVRRIEALSGLNAIRSVLETEDTLKESALLLKGTKSEVPEKIKKILSNQKELERELSKAKQSGSSGDTEKLIESAEIVCGVKVVSGKVELSDPKELRQIADTLRKKIKSGIIILGLESNGKAMLLATVTKDLCERFSAGEIIKNLAPIVGGKGGGKADMAQAGGKDLAKLTEAITTAKSIIEKIGK